MSIIEETLRLFEAVGLIVAFIGLVALLAYAAARIVEKLE